MAGQVGGRVERVLTSETLHHSRHTFLQHTERMKMRKILLVHFQDLTRSYTEKE